MFTGIIEAIGQVEAFCKSDFGAKIKIGCQKILQNTKIGDSISINGCCQTVVEIGNDYFCTDISNETLQVTTFSYIKTGEILNLERALTPESRMGGHIVQGHIDCIAKFVSAEKQLDFYNLIFEFPQDALKYTIRKGSIAINGISLTIADIQNNRIKIAVIPHTYQNTTLRTLNFGDFVNIETDILGRYIEKFLSANDNKSNITENFLKENGFM